VWVTASDGRRLLVGIHLGARIVKNTNTGAQLPVPTNKAAHLSPAADSWVRSLMPGDAVTGGHLPTHHRGAPDVPDLPSRPRSRAAVR
jgi:hypothetical protein